MRKLALMALPLFAFTMSACSDDSTKPEDFASNTNHDFAVKLDGGTPDLTMVGDGGSTPQDLANVDQGFNSTFPAPPTLNAQIDRFGRPGVNTALTDPFWDDGVRTAAQHHAAQDQYNAESNPANWPTLTLTVGDTNTATAVLAIFKAVLPVYDALSGTTDGTMGSGTTTDGCGDQVGFGGPLGAGYTTLATVLTNDRLWVNTASGTCTAYLAVELAALGITNADCGGRTPTYSVIDITYSALAAAAAAPLTCVAGDSTKCGVTDGLATAADADGVPSNTTFPFLIAATN